MNKAKMLHSEESIEKYECEECGKTFIWDEKCTHGDSRWCIDCYHKVDNSFVEKNIRMAMNDRL